MATCTLFSVGDADLASPADETLPTYDDHTSLMAPVAKPHVVELGTEWAPLHRTLGAHADAEPLGFLGGGGERFAPLEDGTRSTGRYFAPAATVKLLAAIAKLRDETVPDGELRRLLSRVRVFLAEAVEGDRGIIVHKLL
ncbi:MAG: hypothetical protein H0T46_08265 [Deltaproteobacteria bacterium]|nr:hypothetical protein [Deltaproteobacteria bacterium]